MKTIFRYTNPALLMAVIIAFGTAAGLAQDSTPAPGSCEDAAGQVAANDKILELFKDKSLAGRKAYVSAGKAFLEKYGACDSAKQLSDYLKPQIPKLEETIKKMQAEADEGALADQFNAALKAKNWDDVYLYGKQILAKDPEKYRPVEIVLGSVGGEEALTKANFKYSDDTLKYAKQSLADLEANKSFMVGKKTAYGLSLFDANKKPVYNFEYANPAEAIAWLNLYIGWITQMGQKNKVAALPYLYKATQSNDTKGKPAPYDLIGQYYIDELNKIYDEIQAIAKSQADTDTEEIAKQKLASIKAKVALAHATEERAMDAVARAANFTTDAAIKAKLRTTLQEIYKRRFDKTEGLEAWVATTTVKPFVNPQTPIQPIVDPEPAKPGATTTTTTPTAPEKPSPPATKPAATSEKPAVTPAAKPTSTAKPQATVKKKVVKKKTT
jgi:hypothetical protein